MKSIKIESCECCPIRPMCHDEDFDACEVFNRILTPADAVAHFGEMELLDAMDINYIYRYER